MSLKQIANRMIKFALSAPYHTGDDARPYQTILPKGLGLTYFIHMPGKQHNLSLSRPGVFPSDKEVEIIKKAFGAPLYLNGKRVERDDHCIIRLQWVDPNQPALFKFDQAAKHSYQ